MCHKSYNWGPTDGIGDLAHGVVAHIEIAKALAFYEARGKGREEVVREGKPGRVSIAGLQLLPAHFP